MSSFSSYHVYLDGLGKHPVMRGPELVAFCPLHEDTVTPNFTVSSGNFLWFCFRCQAGGHFKKLVWLTRFPEVPGAAEAYRLVDDYLKNTSMAYQRGDDTLRPSAPDDATPAERALIREVSARYAEGLVGSALWYVRDRGITDDQIEQYRIGYGGAGIRLNDLADLATCRSLGLVYPDSRNHRFLRRITIPLPRFGNMLGRAAYPDADRKYVCLPRTNPLFETSGVNATQGPIVLVEGIFDALAIEQVGFEAIAIGGTYLRTSQLNRFNGKDVVLCLDGDDAGKEAMDTYQKQLRPIVRGLHRVTLPIGRDPADLMQQRSLKYLELFVRQGISKSLK